MTLVRYLVFQPVGWMVARAVGDGSAENTAGVTGVRTIFFVTDVPQKTAQCLQELPERKLGYNNDDDDRGGGDGGDGVVVMVVVVMVVAVMVVVM